MFGRLVRSHRQRLGLTQQELADKAGVGERSVRNVESGQIEVPRPTTVRLLADALGLTGRQREQFFETAVGVTGPAVPAQLPPDVSWFTGREPQLAALEALLTERSGQDGRGPTAVVIS